MLDLFGPGFYEWWAGLGGAARCAVAIAVLAIAALLWLLDFTPWVWIPALISGAVLLLFVRI